ncbi:MAG TPA: hypothetical protein VIJ54_04185, partial [Actinomycetes bacterium]
VAVEMGALTSDQLAVAVATGERIVGSLQSWPDQAIGDWRGFVPDPSWPVPTMQPSWLLGLAT